MPRKNQNDKTPNQEDQFDVFIPKSVTKRKFQTKIMKSCIKENTMITIPSGTGASTLAGIVAYGFSQKFQNDGLVVHVTKSKQHIQPQLSIQNDVINELHPDRDGIDQLAVSGDVNDENKEALWNSSEIIITSRHILTEDCEADGRVPIEKIKLLIVDDAHECIGKCPLLTVLSKIQETNSEMRIIAITATPGNTEAEVKNVIKNLNISNFQFYNITQIDCNKFAMPPRVKVKLCHMAELPKELNDKFQEILEENIHVLLKAQVLKSVSSKIHPQQLHKILNELQKNKDPKNEQSINSLKIVILMQDSLIRLGQQGYPGFVSYYQTNKLANTIMTSVLPIKGELEKIISQVQGFSSSSSTTSKTKSERIEELIKEQVPFNEDKENEKIIRVMIITTSNDSVDIIYEYVSQTFSSFTIQKITKNTSVNERNSILKTFREEKSGILITTQAGEEFLINRHVNLVIIYDTQGATTIISHQKRLQMATGKDPGKVVYLVSTEKEKKSVETGIETANNFYHQKLVAIRENTSLYVPSPLTINEDNIEIKYDAAVKKTSTEKREMQLIQTAKALATRSQQKPAIKRKFVDKEVKEKVEDVTKGQPLKTQSKANPAKRRKKSNEKDVTTTESLKIPSSRRILNTPSSPIPSTSKESESESQSKIKCPPALKFQTGKELLKNPKKSHKNVNTPLSGTSNENKSNTNKLKLIQTKLNFPTSSNETFQKFTNPKLPKKSLKLPNKTTSSITKNDTIKDDEIINIDD